MRNMLPLFGLGVLLLGSACTGDTAAPITVSGRVVDDRGQPLAGVPVLVFGKGRQPVMTDSEGAFLIPEVTAPYDIAAAGDAVPAGVTVYQGVTRQSLTLIVATTPREPSPRFSAHVKGTVSGGVTPYISPSFPRVDFVSPGNIPTRGWMEYSGPSTSSGNYSLEATWYNAPSVTGSLIAVQAEVPAQNAVPTRYVAYGRRDGVVLTDGATLSLALPMAPVASSTLEGTVQLPSGYTADFHSVSLMLSSDMSVPLFADFSPSAAFAYPVPDLPQGRFQLFASARASDDSSSVLRIKQGVLAGGAPSRLVLRAGPSLQEPAHLATGVTRGTAFSWKDGLGGVHVVSFSRLPAEGLLARDVILITTATHATLPDLSPLGRALPPGTRMQWQVTTYTPLGSVDELLERQRSRALFSAIQDEEESETGSSALREFTTADTF